MAWETNRLSLSTVLLHGWELIHVNASWWYFHRTQCYSQFDVDWRSRNITECFNSSYHRTLPILAHFDHSKGQLRLLIFLPFLKCFNFRSYLRVFSLHVGTNVCECVCMTMCVWAAVSVGSSLAVLAPLLLLWFYSNCTVYMYCLLYTSDAADE